MAPAWLDSLSEDWISQSGSDASDGQLPPIPPPDDVDAAQKRLLQSRIPRRSGNKPSAPPTSGNSPTALSERTTNDINISMKRLPTKLSREVKADTSRAVSDASHGSVVHNSLPNGRSPSKDRQTPEWKRRLVYGEIPYGEQRDLFCSAAAGLEDMFKPPQGDEGELFIGTQHAPHHIDVTLPSSPPTYPQRVTAADLEEFEHSEDGDEYPADITPSPSPRPLQREIKYKCNESSPVRADRYMNSSPGARDAECRGAQNDESNLTVPDENQDALRKASGQTDTRNEDFSPIVIGKHGTESGSVEFAPIDVPIDQLWQKLERLRVNQMLLDSQADLRAGFDADVKKTLGDAENTEDYMHKGGFINVRRGGRSGDGSFYYRGLSSEMGADTSEMLPEESLQASTPKQFPSIRTLGTNPWPTLQSQRSPSLPRAPFPSPEKKQDVGDGGSKENSPLKLFGPYDTFTNQTLLRRISQFEEGSGSPSQRSPASEIEDVVSDKARKGAAEQSDPDHRNISKFGGSDLDGYEFKGHSSDEIYEDSDVIGKENRSPRGDSMRPYPLRVLKGPETSPGGCSDLIIERRRSKSETPLRNQDGQQGAATHQMANGPRTPKRDPPSDSKRQRTSPAKDPTPKRRRTLHRSDIAFGRELQAGAIDNPHAQAQPGLPGKKRKDALPGSFELADPSVLAQRSILQPQSPGSSKNSLASGTKTRQSPARKPPKDREISFNDALTETDRKPSIRTQDFVDQAAQIMAMIRNQVKPELASLGESEEEDTQQGEKQSNKAAPSQDSTSEPFSRPPSREGNPIAWAQQRQNDPELISRLKKYQEYSDGGVTCSMRSADPTAGAVPKAGCLERQVEGRERARPTGIPVPVFGEITSDLPNVRISNSSLPGSEHGAPPREYPSHSSNRSLSRTFPSASSRGSESRQIIMPESVSHLIPDRVGSMYLDKNKNVWIKKKELPSGQQHIPLLSEDSEEDPFASIPDLTVDMTKEMQNLRLVRFADEAEEISDLGHGQSQAKSPARRDLSRGFVTLSTSEPIGSPRGAFMTEEIAKLENSTGHGDSAPPEKSDVGTGRQNHDQASAGPLRSLTISFSSPIASVIQELTPDDLDQLEDESAVDMNRLSCESSSKPSSQKGAQVSNKTQSARGKSSQAPPRQPCHRGPAFIPRPISRIDEQDEESTVEICDDDRQVSIIGDRSMTSHKTPKGGQASLSFMVNQTPGNSVLALAADDSAFIGRNVGKLSLSPLSDFTLNNHDQSFGFEVSYVMGHRHMATGDGSKKVLSMTIRELVDKLGEAEPQESYWEDITKLDLHDKCLSSLHMLDEFCGKLVTLDASANNLNHLDGVPSTVRDLKVSQNLLTEITSWDHLMNLQYLDISGNDLTSLSALKNLVHLRSIRADDNQLTSLDGLDAHDGLLRLRARNNEIESVDFSTSRFERLEELDLENNHIASIQNLELLPVLSKLRLAKNRLHELPEVESMDFLRHLDVSDNDFETLDISRFPGLRSVYADRNRIHSASGFVRTRRLDSLSLREQRGERPLDLGFLAHAYEVRKLFLSGNFMHEFDPRVDFLNLQLLEMANCGLRFLPEKMGQLMPNLRTLNVNFNAIADVSPLRFIPRMKKLLVAGNRLTDSTSVTQLLIDFPHLTRLDTRDNPMTLGFYAPLQILVPSRASQTADLFVLPDADVSRDEIFACRLDENTRLRRRLHQVVFAANCGRLRMLDGLPLRFQDVLAKDGLLQRLMDEGLVPDQLPHQQENLPPMAEPKPKGNDEDEDTVADELARAQLESEAETAWQHNTTIKSSRWSKEDSFA